MRISRVITRTPEDEVEDATATVETTTAEEGWKPKRTLKIMKKKKKTAELNLSPSLISSLVIQSYIYRTTIPML